jgi:hypothetical protein
METAMHTKPKRNPPIRGINGKLYRGRHYRATLRAILGQLSGEATLWQRMVAESAACLQVQIEDLRSQQAAGEPIDTAALVKATGALRRLLRDLALSEDGDA